MARPALVASGTLLVHQERFAFVALPVSSIKLATDDTAVGKVATVHTAELVEYTAVLVEHIAVLEEYTAKLVENTAEPV